MIVSDAGARTDEVVSARHITRSFGSFDALRDVSLSISEGQFVSIVGPSGCGKSTLLQIIAGLNEPNEGEVLIDERKISGPNPGKVGVVFQEALLLPWKTAAQNIEFPLKLNGIGTEKDRRRQAEDLLELVGLGHAADLYPHQLSGGMRQRVSIARGLVRNPRVLLMDEPFGALDEQTRNRMWEELLRIREKRRSTILFITHSLIEAVYLADVVYVMAAGPGRFVERIEVDLPKPRTLDLLGSERLGALRNRLWQLISDPHP